jgi:hypothetical protein
MYFRGTGSAPFSYAYPREIDYSGCKVGTSSSDTQTIDQKSPFEFTANGLSHLPQLDNPDSQGNFTITFLGSKSNPNGTT